MNTVAESICRGLVVACQAAADSPLHGPDFAAAMARCAEIAGAVAIRADGPDDIRAIRSGTSLPIIGIYKRRDMDPEVYITPSIEEVAAVVAAGANAIAVDATHRPRRYGSDPEALIQEIHRRFPGVPVMADVAVLAEGVDAAAAGADAVATTLAGYTDYSRAQAGPDLDLVADLTLAVTVPVVAEGRYQYPAQVADALRRGAHAVVVGTAITNPIEIARGFVAGAAAGLASRRR